MSFCVFPSFAVFGGPKIPRCWEKKQTKSVIVTPFLCVPLVAPYCASHRETISAIPPYCALWGFWCLNMANWVRSPPLFSVFPPWGACEVEVRYPPPQKGYLSDTCAIPYKNKANGCDTPLCDTISKGYCVIGGGISHWAAKCVPQILVQN